MRGCNTNHMAFNKCAYYLALYRKSLLILALYDLDLSINGLRKNYKKLHMDFPGGQNFYPTKWHKKDKKLYYCQKHFRGTNFGNLQKNYV